MGKHCGYQGNSLGARLSRKLIPDEPCGVDISECCKLHDKGWTIEANKRADLKLKERIEDKFIQAGKPIQGKVVSWIYYIGVRIGGIPDKLLALCGK
jgi:hypothetical protein